MGYSIAEGSGQTAGSTTTNQQAQPPLEIQQQAMAAGYGPLTPEAAARALSVNNSAATSTPIDTRTYAADIDDISVSNASIGQYEVTPGQKLFHLSAEADTWQIVEGQIKEANAIAQAQERMRAMVALTANRGTVMQQDSNAASVSSGRPFDYLPEGSKITLIPSQGSAGSSLGTVEGFPRPLFSGGALGPLNETLGMLKGDVSNYLDARGASAAKAGRNFEFGIVGGLRVTAELGIPGNSIEAGAMIFGGPVVAKGLGLVTKYAPNVFPVLGNDLSVMADRGITWAGRELGEFGQRVLGDILDPAWAKAYLIPPGTVASKGASFFDNLAIQATRNPDSNKVVFGKFLEDGKSYTKVASHYEASYFKLDNYQELSSRLTSNEMWQINKSFLDQQIASGKEIILSHDPIKATGFFSREVQRLEDLGYKFVQDGWVWRAMR